MDNFFSNPVQFQPVNTSLYAIDRCTDTAIGFEFYQQQVQPTQFRYCNKILVTECVPVAIPQSMNLSKVEFYATEDPCYRLWDVYKSSENTNDIELQYNENENVIGVIVRFFSTETEDLPIRMAYRLYGYEDDCKILLAQGDLNLK